MCSSDLYTANLACNWLFFLIVQPVARQICRICRQTERKTVYNSKYFDTQAFSDCFFHSYMPPFFSESLHKNRPFFNYRGKNGNFLGDFCTSLFYCKDQLNRELLFSDLHSHNSSILFNQFSNRMQSDPVTVCISFGAYVPVLVL